jgi:hypothetical protein
MGVTLVSAGWSGKVPGFDAGQAKDCMFMHDPTVRRWIAERQAAETDENPARIIVADDEWVNPGGFESLTFPVDPRDMEVVEGIRWELGLPPGRRESSEDANWLRAAAECGLITMEADDAEG